MFFDQSNCGLATLEGGKLKQLGYLKKLVVGSI